MIKQTFRALAVVAALGVAVPASADVLGMGDSVRMSDGPGTNASNGGGAFTITSLADNSFWTTFCLEIGEYINYTDTYKVAAISDRTTSRNVAISDKTQAVYHKFRNGNANGWSGAEVQYAIWNFEGQGTYGSFANITNWLATTEFTGGYDFGSDSVAVVQLTTLAGGKAQDQLMLRSVPEPGSMMLVGLGLLASGAAARRRQRAA